MTDQHSSAPIESRVELPADLDTDGRFDVYINGVLQEDGTDYQLDGRTLVFPRDLAPDLKMTKLQLLRATLGIAGTYTKHDTIDITYQHQGQRRVATGLTPRSSTIDPAG